VTRVPSVGWQEIYRWCHIRPAKRGNAREERAGGERTAPRCHPEMTASQSTRESGQESYGEEATEREYAEEPDETVAVRLLAATFAVETLTERAASSLRDGSRTFLEADAEALVEEIDDLAELAEEMKHRFDPAEFD